MTCIVKRLTDKQLISPPKYVTSGIQYETMMGSVAYGVSSDTSDVDIYGFCIPNKDMIFPHLKGEILGFGKQTQRYEQYQIHHVKDEDAKKEYDITIYSIVKYFQLCMENNPNMIDSLFTPRRCVLFTTKIGELVRENRKEFLHKGSFHKFKSYAYSQLHKIKTKNPIGKRKDIITEFGYDVKFAYHLVRLLNECEQILTEHDIDLERNREQLKAIRRGEYSEEQIENYFYTKEKELETLYNTSTLRYGPDETKIKNLLLRCLEEHFGSIDNCIVNTSHVNLINDIDEVLNKYRSIR